MLDLGLLGNILRAQGFENFLAAAITEIISIYCSLIHSVLEYACPVWHPDLYKGHHKNIKSSEEINKNALSFIIMCKWLILIWPRVIV